ncbi:hypothetical protein SIN8267_02024 [Sinobacterium norvegicum]|uniref:DUF3094 family protein n=1 Tax=Sinobacterium norvegicum TaxID=1641715 RepID=A0ABN8EIM9_9GAMM|nr:DUF3094 family protein [Sinobacterium norvegicum]CAH0991909.1 hypothetical protein SIN8267_02024 [Sinobacterium norvegicum]
MEENKLNEEDQQRVDEYCRSGFNKTERPPFKPMRLLLGLLAIVGLLSVCSIFLARMNGIY